MEHYKSSKIVANGPYSHKQYLSLFSKTIFILINTTIMFCDGWFKDVYYYVTQEFLKSSTNHHSINYTLRLSNFGGHNLSWVLIVKTALYVLITRQ